MTGPTLIDPFSILGFKHIPTVDGRNPTNQLMSSLSHYLWGFIHPRWCRISSINSINPTKPDAWIWMIITSAARRLVNKPLKKRVRWRHGWSPWATYKKPNRKCLLESDMLSCLATKALAKKPTSYGVNLA